MTYCLGVLTKSGLIMASDSRTNAGLDQATMARKTYTFVQPGQRVFIILVSGGLSVSQSIMTLLKRDFDRGAGLADAPTLYDAARVVGEQIRKVAGLDKDALERDGIPFNVNVLIGGQVKGDGLGLYQVYPQGNPLMATEDVPYLQIGETKYGRPILDRGINYQQTTLEEACKYAMLSMDSTMKSNVSVGPPIDLTVYVLDELRLLRQRRFELNDPDLMRIRTAWDRELRQAVHKLPTLRFVERGTDASVNADGDSIELVDPSAAGNGDVTSK